MAVFCDVLQDEFAYELTPEYDAMGTGIVRTGQEHVDLIYHRRVKIYSNIHLQCMIRPNPMCATVMPDFFEYF